MNKPIFVVNQHSQGQRLDNYLRKQRKQVTTGQLYKLIRKGQVRINGKRCQPSAKLQNGDLVRVPPFVFFEESETQSTIPPALISHLLDAVIAEDDDYLVVNKPAGMAVHKGTGHDYGVIEILQQDDRYRHILLSHRLDVVTSGCLVLAKSRPALLTFQEQLKSRQVDKTYGAILEGTLEKAVTVEQNLRDTRINNIKTAVCDPEGKSARTHIEPLQDHAGFTQVVCSPVTGRTHQIRAHCAYLQCPIVGDQQYGARQRNGLTRSVYLHAHQITFAKYTFCAPLPVEFEQFWQSLDS